jgi:hypothetical protein
MEDSELARLLREIKKKSDKAYRHIIGLITALAE